MTSELEQVTAEWLESEIQHTKLLQRKTKTDAELEKSRYRRQQAWRALQDMRKDISEPVVG